MCKSCDMADDFYDWWEENKKLFYEDEISFRDVASKAYYAGRMAVEHSVQRTCAKCVDVHFTYSEADGVDYCYACGTRR